MNWGRWVGTGSRESQSARPESVDISWKHPWEGQGGRPREQDKGRLFLLHSWMRITSQAPPLWGGGDLDEEFWGWIWGLRGQGGDTHTISRTGHPTSFFQQINQ